MSCKQVAPLRSAQEMYDSVMQSPHRNYFLSITGVFLGAIFLVGLCFGRVSKRKHSDIKNR